MKTLKNISQVDFNKMDGLVPVIIQDAETQNVLMLGFMNDEALFKTQEIGKVLFDINSMSQKEKASLQKAVSNTVQYNFDWFYSDKFENILWNELNEMTEQW